MIWLIYLLKTMAIQVIAFGCYKLLLDEEPLGHWKRGYLLGSLLLSLIIPLVAAPSFFMEPEMVWRSAEVLSAAELAPVGLDNACAQRCCLGHFHS